MRKRREESRANLREASEVEAGQSCVVAFFFLGRALEQQVRLRIAQNFFLGPAVVLEPMQTVLSYERIKNVVKPRNSGANDAQNVESQSADKQQAQTQGEQPLTELRRNVPAVS